MVKFYALILVAFIFMYPKNVNASILNNVQDPCISELVNISISESMTNEISTLIKKFYCVNDSINLTIDQVYDLEDSLDAVTSGYYNPFGVLSIDISFNGNTMPTASKEYIMATLYHEFLHAILFHNGAKRGMHHEPIATEYRKILTYTLLQHFPTLSKDEASCLSWTGLEETKVWNCLSVSEREAIFNINQDHQAGRKGSKCN